MGTTGHRRTAIIIGAGPAGLTAAYELLAHTDIVPIVLEKSDLLGGLARTVNYKGNRIDIGGHRFFSKSDRVMRWWFDLLPLQKLDGDQTTISYQGASRAVSDVPSCDPATSERVMLVRSRKSRIYFRRRFFDYPLRLSRQTIQNLGFLRVFRIGLSYLRVRLFPLKSEDNLEEFLINRFGRELYRTFFQAYTEKVWGVTCREISAAWGAQRIKGLSIGAALAHIFKRALRRGDDLAQSDTQTSLIERFVYPKYGPGQMWETCAAQVVARGGQIVHHADVQRILVDGQRVVAVAARDCVTGAETLHHGDYFLSSMPIRDAIAGLEAEVPPRVREIAQGLVYRDFITVGLLLRKLRLSDASQDGPAMLKDNWIYIQEPDVRVGRLQIFNNWSPYMVADPDTVWVGLEYFCNEGDDLWQLSDADMTALAQDELVRLGIVERGSVLDATVIRMPKAYPAYFGSYAHFDELRRYIDQFENLFLIGRNGQHRYNNQDHSMLTAMTAVENIVAGQHDKSNLWEVNAEQDYHETRTSC